MAKKHFFTMSPKEQRIAAYKSKRRSKRDNADRYAM